MCKVLAGLDEVDEVVIGARNLEKAQEAAGQCGDNVSALQVDAMDVPDLVRKMADFDIILNASSYRTAVPAVKAAIAAGKNYCDMTNDTTAREQLHDAAEAAGITAIIGCGLGPGIINMAAVHISAQLDTLVELQGYGDPSAFINPRAFRLLRSGADPEEICGELLRVLDRPEGSVDMIEYAFMIPWPSRDLGLVFHFIDPEFALQYAWQPAGTAQALGFVDGAWQYVDPMVVQAPIPALGATTGRPRWANRDSFNFYPRHDWEPGATRSHLIGTGFPIRLNERVAALAEQVRAGKLEIADAAAAVRADLRQDPAYWLAQESRERPQLLYALGYKDGRPAKVTLDIGDVFNANWRLLNSGPLAVAALCVWRGDVKRKGVMVAEETFSWPEFGAELAPLLPEPPADGQIFHDTLSYMD
jgi:hypothetical protein